jgi:hypothetical protein
MNDRVFLVLLAGGACWRTAAAASHDVRRRCIAIVPLPAPAAADR